MPKILSRRAFVRASVAQVAATVAAHAAVTSGQPRPVAWAATHESGDLREWTIDGTLGGTFNSGEATTLVSEDVSRSGRFSCRMTIDTTNRRESGCRQFRHEEDQSGRPYYHSVWYYVPRHYVAIDFWNIFQFKSKTDTGLNDPFWVIDLMPRRTTGSMHLVLRWKGLTPGPWRGDLTRGATYFRQELLDVPIARWFHVEAYLRQSSEFGGQLTVWQDGVRLWRLRNVRTRYHNGDNRWSVNNYSDGISPSPTTLYIDDAVISPFRIWPFRNNVPTTDRSAIASSRL